MVCDPDIWQIGEVVSCEAEESEGSGRVSVVLLRVSVTLNMNINEMIFKAPQMSVYGRWIRWEAAHIHLGHAALYYSTNMREYEYERSRPRLKIEKN